MTHAEMGLGAKDWFSRPGDSVLSAMRRRRVSAARLAEELQGGLGQLKDLLRGHGDIDLQTAGVLAKTLGGTVDFWTSRQRNYRESLKQAVVRLSDEDAEAWLARIPAPGAKTRPSVTARAAELELRLAFYGVSTLKSWDARYGPHQSQVKFRRSLAFTQHDGATSMWLRQGELEANLVETAAWSSDRLRERLERIRSLSKISKPARFLPTLVKLLAEAGVALVVVRAPSGCRASGASRMIAPDKAMILMSFRHRSDDQFWFTLFHEIGHLLLHNATSFVDTDGIGGDDPHEREANDFAADVIVPRARKSELDALAPQEEAIRRFAVSIGVAPGLVLGQLEHLERVPHGAFRRLRRTWTWDQIEAAD